MQAGKITWESRRKSAKGAFPFRLQRPYSLVVSDEVSERTWLGFFLPPAVRDAGRKNHLGEQEAERRSNFVHPVPFFRCVFNEIRECGIAERVRLIFDAPCKKNSS